MQLGPTQRVEDNRLVDAVEKLREEVLPQGGGDPFMDLLGGSRPGQVHDCLAADVRRHHHDGVREVDGPPLAVGEASIVEQLQQDVEDVAVRLLDFVEQQHAVRLPPDRLGQSAPLLVPDVSGGRPHQPRDVVPLHEFAHVDADQRLFVVEQELGERFAELGLAHPGGTEEQEGPDRAVAVLQPRAGPPDGV